MVQAWRVWGKSLSDVHVNRFPAERAQVAVPGDNLVKLLSSFRCLRGNYWYS